MTPDPVKESIAHQFHSALAMLRRAIELCPDPLWLEGSPNRSWHIAYHALFYLHFYLAPNDKEFVPWPHHRHEYNFLGSNPAHPGALPVIDQAYTREELLSYADFCSAEIDARVPSIDLSEPSGFFWLPFSKFELQLYNLRHFAHHTGQLADRVRTQAGLGVAWVR